MLPTKTVLIAPLDWGIGHASRCIPIIKELQKLNQEVIVAADGAPLDLLKKVFPTLQFEVFPAYTPRYGNTNSLVWPVIKQSPILFWQGIKDHCWMESFVNKTKIDGIISDNRFGAFSKKVPSVFITHQLHIKPPKSLAFSSPIIELVNKTIVRNYSTCWIPDFEGNQALAGELSNPPFKDISINYIGPLSRFEEFKAASNNEKEVIDFLVIISGPEPQRSIFEENVLSQLKGRNESVVILRGLPHVKSVPDVSENIRMLNHAIDDQFFDLISSARFVVARAGYSTIMDLVAMKKSALLIPTPGQTEQEYLAEYHENRGFFHRKLQSDTSYFDSSFRDSNRMFLKPFQESRLSDILREWICNL